jgi:hypothetical protein
MNMAAASATKRMLATYQTTRLHIPAVCNITERVPQKPVIQHYDDPTTLNTKVNKFCTVNKMDKNKENMALHFRN